MDTVELNNSMFLIGGLCAGGVLPLTGTAVTFPIRLPAAAAMLVLGVITGVGFLLQAEGFKTVPIFVATVVQSSTVLLSLLWASLLYRERITGWIVAGTVLFLGGILLVNVKPRRQP
jgi:drug/metabolite transporter (DMT)-like permease